MKNIIALIIFSLSLVVHAQSRGYTSCRDAGYSHTSCSGQRPSYTVCRDEGFSHSSCNGQKAGYVDCRRSGYGHDSCSGQSFNQNNSYYPSYPSYMTGNGVPATNIGFGIR